MASSGTPWWTASRCGLSDRSPHRGCIRLELLRLDLGFEEFREEEGAVQLTVGGAGRRRCRGDRREVSPGRGVAAGDASARFFLMIHTYEVHTPTAVWSMRAGSSEAVSPRGSRRRRPRCCAEWRTPTDAELVYIRALYDGGVAVADRHLGGHRCPGGNGFVRAGAEVVTNDHGEDLGDRAPPRPGTHGHSLYDELLLVPLVIYDPRLEGAVSRVRAQVRLVDVLPTILDLLGVRGDSKSHGRSLAPLMRGEDVEARSAYAQIVSTREGARSWPCEKVTTS